MCGAAGTFISLVIVGAIIGAYGDSLATNKVAGWAGVAFIYIYDVNFSYSFGKLMLPVSRRFSTEKSRIKVKVTNILNSTNRLGPPI